MNQLTLHRPELKKLRLMLATNRGPLKVNKKQFTLYQNFFFLLKKYPSLKAVPSKAIDEIWHIHLSNQSLYIEDCIKYFGYIIYHKEASENVDKALLMKNFIHTNNLWQETFNTKMAEIENMALCGVDSDDVGDDGGNNIDDY